MPVDMQATLDELGLGNVFEEVTEEMLLMLMQLLQELVKQFKEDENLNLYDLGDYEEAVKEFREKIYPLVSDVNEAAQHGYRRDIILSTIERMRPEPEPEPEPEEKEKGGNTVASRGRKNRNDKGLEL